MPEFSDNVKLSVLALLHKLGSTISFVLSVHKNETGWWGGSYWPPMKLKQMPPFWAVPHFVSSLAPLGSRAAMSLL